MRSDRGRSRCAAHTAAILAALLWASSDRAQDEPPEPEAPPPPPAAAEEAEPSAPGAPAGAILVEAEVWVAQPVGTEYYPATEIDPDDPFGTQVLTIGHGTEPEGRFRAAFTLPNAWGTIVGTYLVQKDNATLTRSEPGQPIFGEILTHPLYAGFLNDQIADRFDAQTRTRLNDWRIDLSRPGFRTPRVRGDWFVGWRRVKHIRGMGVVYRTSLPGLPPLLPPNVVCGLNGCPTVRAGADQANHTSTFEGRGLEGGLNVVFDLWRDKLVLESSVGLAVLRGDIKAGYGAQNMVYICTAALCGQDLIVNPPYDFFDDPVNTGDDQPHVVGEFIQEVGVPFGLELQAVEATSNVLDASIALRYRALRWLEVFGGFRQTHYTDVGLDVRPKAINFNVANLGFLVISFEDVTQVERSVTYEGLYGGLAFRVK